MDRTVIRNAGLSLVLCAGLGFGGLAISQPAFADEAEDEAAATETVEDEAEETEDADEAEETDAAGLVDGTYEASGTGIGGKVPVTVTIEDGVIASVEIGDNSETQGIGSNAIDQLPDEFVGMSTVEEVEELDGVSGATITSNAIKNAVIDCLEQAAASDETETEDEDATEEETDEDEETSGSSTSTGTRSSSSSSASSSSTSTSSSTSSTSSSR